MKVRVTPKNISEANEWVQRFVAELHSSGLIHMFESKIECGYQLVAKTFGWESWEALVDHISIPHETYYIDGNDQILETLVTRMGLYLETGSLGYVEGLIKNSGVGYSEFKRKNIDRLWSPWGQIIEKTTVVDGIDFVETCGHGGFILSPEMSLEIPPHLSNGTLYYEQDCESALIHLAFPDVFKESIAYDLASYPISIYNLDSSIEASEAEPVAHLQDRELSDIEIRVVEYLSTCVLKNRMPICTPDSQHPSLQDWVLCLSRASKLDGTWPLSTSKTVWKEHFW